MKRLISTLAFSLIALSCAQEGPAERTGQAIDDAADRIGDAARDVRDDAEDFADEVRDDLDTNR